jgi:predicted phosphate transport protein (TIGR00153 family)
LFIHRVRSSMKIDAILHALLPKDDSFFTLLEKDSANLLLAANTFRDLMSNQMSKEERSQKIRKIEEIEHRGDEITHQIFKALGTTYITPFDREDIHILASKLDDILDYIQGAANRIVLYRIETITPESERLAGLVHDAVVELNKAIPMLRDLRNAAAINESLVKINSMENEADDLFERAIASLFETSKDPIQIIKLKEILVSLETATDQCEDAANAIESVLVKHA